MATFGMGMHGQPRDAGVLRGKQREIACDCWFTSKGKIIPRMIKFEDEEGILQTLQPIVVHVTEEKRFCGISTRVYQCSAVHEQTVYYFQLIYRKEECRWFLIWV